MPGSPDPRAAAYLDELRRHLAPLAAQERNGIILELEDYLEQELTNGAHGQPPAIESVLARLGPPAELARRYLPPDAAPAAAPPRRRRLVLAAVALFALAMLGLLAGVRAREPQTDRAAATARLNAILARYSSADRFSARVLIETRMLGAPVWSEHNLYHRGRETVLRSNVGGEVPHLYLSDTRTILYRPWSRQYESFDRLELAGAVRGNSLLLSLLHRTLAPAQVTINAADVQEIVTRDTGVTYTIEGVYFGWGDARFTVTIDAARQELVAFTAAKAREAAEYRDGKPRLYTETIFGSRFEPELPAEAMRFSVPAGAQAAAGMGANPCLTFDQDKGGELIGRPAPDFAGTDRRTGRRVSLADYRGRPLLIVTCASWIPWDRTYLATLNELHARYHPVGLEIVNLAPDVEPAHTDALLRKLDLHYPYLTDFRGWESPCFTDYGLYRIGDYSPAFIAVGRDGIVLAASSGYPSPIADPLETFLAIIRPLVGDTDRVEREFWRRYDGLPAAEQLVAARRYYDRGDDFHARTLLERMRRSEPGNANPVVELCRLVAEYQSTGGKPLAEAALALTDTSPYPYLLLGDYCGYEEMNAERMLREYEKAARLAPDDGLVQTRLGDYYALLGNPARAEPCYLRALAADPLNTHVRMKLGEVHSSRQEWEKGLAQFQRGLAALGPMRGAHDQLVPLLVAWVADMHEELNDIPNSIAWLERALRYDRNDDNRLWSLARLLTFHTDRSDSAVEVAGRLIALDRSGKHSHLYGCALTKAGRYAEAVAALTETTTLEPGYPYTWTNLGFAYEGLGDTENAKRCFRESVTRFPDCWLTAQAREHLADLERIP